MSSSSSSKSGLNGPAPDLYHLLGLERLPEHISVAQKSRRLASRMLACSLQTLAYPRDPSDSMCVHAWMETAVDHLSLYASRIHLDHIDQGLRGGVQSVLSSLDTDLALVDLRQTSWSVVNDPVIERCTMFEMLVRPPRSDAHPDVTSRAGVLEVTVANLTPAGVRWVMAGKPVQQWAANTLYPTIAATWTYRANF